MLPTPKNLSVWPSVVPANKVSRIVICPNERAFLLFDGEEYTLRVMAVNSDDDYYKPKFDTLQVTPKDGVIDFDYAFGKEQEYVLQLIYNEKLLQKFNLYALDEDLYALTPLRGDLHTHSYRSDGRRDPAALAGHYREQGFDFIALTDHNRYYPGGEIDETYAGVKSGFCRVIGEEIHAPQITVHVVHIGGSESVCEMYLTHRDAYEKEVAAYLEKLPADLPENYAERYAKLMWVSEKVHKVGGLAIFPHPFWRPSDRTYNVDAEFARRLLLSGMFDAYELIGGMAPFENNCSVALWNDLRAEGLKLPIVGSSDTHVIENVRPFANYFTIAFAKANESGAITDAVRAGMTVAVEACGEEYKRQYRAYGSYRLVVYSQFLLNHYFPLRQRMCQGEGYAMRAYAMGEAGAGLIEAEAEMTNDFRDRFFGRKAPILPGEKIIAFEEKWRKIHIEKGPVTKGSDVDSVKITRQI